MTHRANHAACVVDFACERAEGGVIFEVPHCAVSPREEDGAVARCVGILGRCARVKTLHQRCVIEEARIRSIVAIDAIERHLATLGRDEFDLVPGLHERLVGMGNLTQIGAGFFAGVALLAVAGDDDCDAGHGLFSLVRRRGLCLGCHSL